MSNVVFILQVNACVLIILILLMSIFVVIFSKKVRRKLGLQRNETVQRQSNRLPQAMERRQPSQCAVCLEEFKDDDEEDCRFLFYNCKHQYHKLCIDHWLAKETRCPLCHGSTPGSRSSHQITGTVQA
ncbi:RING-H2 finger protein ATL47-like [Durio zibethinus]|uniref:RING-H2 finger protein ATL47-like n=1 Tax=Durio zibethinus TaxID=66656 RepID=A0A6P5YNS4_DURZI|nr:RING-H2 finger protein ATL47-like [Durio zibethinus]